MNNALAGSRVTVRPVNPGDLPLIEGWWPEAAAAVRGVREPVALYELHRTIGDDVSETLVIAWADAPAPIGLLVYRLTDNGWLEFRFLALAKGLRGWGYGSEAVRLIEESGRAQRFAADVYAKNGLGLYFWLRIGYRPGRPPWKKREAGDRTTMIREQEE